MMMMMMAGHMKSSRGPHVARGHAARKPRVGQHWSRVLLFFRTQYGKLITQRMYHKQKLELREISPNSQKLKPKRLVVLCCLDLQFALW